MCLLGQAQPESIFRDRLKHVVVGGVGLVVLVLALATGSQDYQEAQSVLRSTQTVRRLRKAAAAAVQTTPLDRRALVNKTGSSIVCSIHEPTQGAPATERAQRTTVLLIAEDGMFMTSCL